MGRPLRRMLKQLGSGSLDRGLQQLRSDETALQELAQLIHVEPAVSASCMLTVRCANPCCTCCLQKLT